MGPADGLARRPGPGRPLVSRPSGVAELVGTDNTALEIEYDWIYELRHYSPNCPYQGKHAADCNCQGEGGDR